MTVRVGINGFGRIGRNFFRAALAAGRRHRDRRRQRPRPTTRRWRTCSSTTSILGRLADERRRSATTTIVVDGKTIKALRRARPGASCPWGDLGADIVIESTGFFTDADQGARRTSTAAPRRSSSRRPATNEDITIVMGVNDDDVRPGHAHDHLERVLHDELPRARWPRCSTTRSASSAA